ncbi:unnamed protein product [Boreogadus saida]
MRCVRVNNAAVPAAAPPEIHNCAVEDLYESSSQRQGHLVSGLTARSTPLAHRPHANRRRHLLAGASSRTCRSDHGRSPERTPPPCLMVHHNKLKTDWLEERVETRHTLGQSCGRARQSILTSTADPVKI